MEKRQINEAGKGVATMTRFKIGTEFMMRGHNCKIVDILKTYNSKNELVKTRYVVEHQLMGNTVTDYDVCETSIAIAFSTEARHE